MHFIKEIFHGEQDQEHIHRKFVKYSRGEFNGPAIKIKNSGNLLKINASDEYVNILGEILIKNSAQNLNFSGDIISREDPGEVLSELGIPIKKSIEKKGVYTLKVEGSLPAGDLLKVYSGLKGAYIFLDLDSPEGNTKLKTKKKMARPGSGGNLKFCSVNLNPSQIDAIKNEICFSIEVNNFKEIMISHRYIIKDLLTPEEYKENFALARIHAKRKGTIKRLIEIDGKKTETQHEFSV